jgi:hypothetical protein
MPSNARHDAISSLSVLAASHLRSGEKRGRQTLTGSPEGWISQPAASTAFWPEVKQLRHRAALSSPRAFDLHAAQRRRRARPARCRRFSGPAASSRMADPRRGRRCEQQNRTGKGCAPAAVQPTNRPACGASRAVTGALHPPKACVPVCFRLTCRCTAEARRASGNPRDH